MGENVPFGVVDPNHRRPRPKPPVQDKPCPKCGSSRVRFELKGAIVELTCQDCGHVWQEKLPEGPGHD